MILLTSFMSTLETLVWGLIASSIRILKEYIKKKHFSFIYSALTVVSGATAAYLFTPEIISHFSLDDTKSPIVAFIVGLMGKDIIEIILSVDLKSYISIDNEGIHINLDAPSKDLKDKKKDKDLDLDSEDN